MKAFKYEETIDKKLGYGKVLTISLTGEYSHQAFIQPGQGSFSIGVKGIDAEKFTDVWVDKDDKINWDSFNRCEIFFPERLKDDDVYSGWPRFFYYTGNDIGFIEWSKKRNIEDFTWKPQMDMNVDFSNSHIGHLYIHSNNKLDMIIGDYVKYLDLYGNLNNFKIVKCSKVPSLGFYPEKDDKKEIYSLPIFDNFHNAEELLVEVDPNGAPFDCKSILQFPNLKLLHLVGNVTNLSSLKELKHLDKLGFWDSPDLSGLPKLDTWKELTKFVAMNIDENVGRRLKDEIKEMKKNEQYKFLSVNKLRNKLWFETEYGIPFSNWDSQMEKKATRIFKKCLKEVKSSLSEADVKKAILEYTSMFNKMDNIESVERDDIYSGLDTIMKNCPINIKYEDWFKWFDETRDF